MSLSYGGRRQCSPVAARNFHCFCLVAAADDNAVGAGCVQDIDAFSATGNVNDGIVLVYGDYEFRIALCLDDRIAKFRMMRTEFALEQSLTMI